MSCFVTLKNFHFLVDIECDKLLHINFIRVTGEERSSLLFFNIKSSDDARRYFDRL